jgi:predicted dehydrogenase
VSGAEPLGVGFVGAGWMGAAQLKLLSRRQDVRICALLEPNSERGVALLSDLGLNTTTLTKDFDQLLRNPSIDAIWLVSPNSFHGPQSIAAMKAGKHVFCEKPCATSFADFGAQIELQQKNPQLISYVDYILYFDTLEQTLRRMVAEGAFGAISQVQVNYRHPVNIAGDKAWKLQKQIMGDAIGMGINHALSVMLLAMQSQGRPIEVYATSQPAKVRGFEADPVWNILIRFDNGATGFCFGNIDNGNGYDAYHNLYGTEGAFVFDSGLDRPQKVRYWSARQTGGKWIYPLDAPRCAREGAQDLAWPADSTTPDSGDVIHHQIGSAVEHFLECVRAGKPSPLSFTNSAIIGEVGWAARLSATSGKPVALPLSMHATAALMGL